MPQISSVQEQVQQSQPIITKILAQMESRVFGKSQECRLALACILAQGHLLIEDLPGMGKTTLAHVLATSLGLSYQRTQFTNDLLPADVIGFSIFNNENNNFELHKGPIFNQVILADEINRASPKTQSALLEAMAEQQVSIDGITHHLPRPFFVIATQNPLFHSGTYPLPESQLDRFMMRLSLGFPDLKAEKQILLSDSWLTNQALSESETQNLAVVEPEQLLNMQQTVTKINVSNEVVEYILALSQVSRRAYIHESPVNNSTISDEKITCNPLSPRASKSLLQAAKAIAFIDNRDYVLPDDVQTVFYVVCEHRLEMQASYTGSLIQGQAASISKKILDSIDVLNPFDYQ